MKFRVAFLGFSEFERSALGSFFRLAERETRYVQVQMLSDADFLVADADHAPSVQLVVATDRVAETVFIGSQAPPGAVAWMMRPIDTLHVMRELDAMVSVQRTGTRDRGAGGTRVSPRRRSMQLPPAPVPPQPGLADPVNEAPPLRLREILRPPASESLLERAASALPPASPPSRRTAESNATAALTLTAQSAPVTPTTPSTPTSTSRWTPMTPMPTTPATYNPQKTLGAQKTPNVPTATPQPSSQQPRALIVDDSAIAQRYLEIRLLRWGLSVDRAEHSARAGEMMLRHSYDLVFIDVELGPDSPLDGLALCQQIKQSVAAMNVTVIMVSAHHTELDRVRGALAGCDGYLGKPLDQAELDRLLLRHGLNAPSAMRKKSKSAAAAG